MLAAAISALANPALTINSAKKLIQRIHVYPAPDHCQVFILNRVSEQPAKYQADVAYH